MLRHPSATLLAAAGLAASPATAQTATSVFLAPSDAPILLDFNVNTVGGYALLAGDGTLTSSTKSIFGSADGVAPATVLATEAAFGLEDLVTAPSLTPSGDFAFKGRATNDDDLIFLNGVVVASENGAVPADSRLGTYRVQQRPQVAETDGALSFFTSINPPAGGGANALLTDSGNTEVAAFILNPSSAATQINGQAVTFIDPDYEASTNGDRLVTPVRLADNGTNESILLYEANSSEPRSLVFAGGALIREGDAITEAAGGRAGDLWDNFDRTGVSNFGSILLTGDLDDAAGDSIEYLFANGTIQLREGDAIGGGVIDGSFATAELSDTGTWATITTVGGVGTLIVDGEAILAEGSQVAYGVTMTELTSFSTGVDRLGITPTDEDGFFDVFFEGQTALGAALFSVTIPEPASAVLLAGAGALLLGRRRRA